MVKTMDWILSFVLEDFVEIGLQFFYFEKYQFLNDTFANINAGFMVVKTFEMFMRPIISEQGSYYHYYLFINIIFRNRRRREKRKGKVSDKTYL